MRGVFDGRLVRIDKQDLQGKWRLATDAECMSFARGSL